MQTVSPLGGTSQPAKHGFPRSNKAQASPLTEVFLLCPYKEGMDLSVGIDPVHETANVLTEGDRAENWITETHDLSFSKEEAYSQRRSCMFAAHKN